MARCPASGPTTGCRHICIPRYRVQPVFVSTKLSQDENILKNKVGRPLLDYVVLPSFSHWCSASAEMVNLLLQHGADPNYRYTNWTAWENALRYVCVTKDPLDQDRWVQILELLIENGADQNACYKGSSSKSWKIEMHSALSIIDKRFDSRANNLRYMLRGDGAGDSPKQPPPVRENDKGKGTMKPLIPAIGLMGLLRHWIGI
jgi:hypothetical protein